MGYAIGIVLALGVVVLARAVGFDRDRAFYPAVLIIVASYYVLFAVMGGSMQALIVELFAMMAFTLVAVIGFKRHAWLIAAGLAAHGTFDYFHSSLVTNPGTPEWWPAFCLAFDVALAGAVACPFTQIPGRMPTMKTKLLIAVVLFSLSVAAVGAQSPDPQFTSDGQLKRPDNYREWIYLSSGLGMTYGVVETVVNTVFGERFDNVFVTPQAYKAFLRTGTWPDKTMFILEVRSSSTKGSINKGGHYQEGVVGLEAHVKDQARFPNGWAFFNLGTSAQTAKPLPANSACQACHAASGAVDNTFVQFYPTLLPVATAKGTIKPGLEK